MNITDRERDLLGIPKPLFLYTVDQLCTMLAMNKTQIFEKVLWLNGREISHQPRTKLRTINIAQIDQAPEWRVEEEEFVRWARVTGFRTYDRSRHAPIIRREAKKPESEETNSNVENQDRSPIAPPPASS